MSVQHHENVVPNLRNGIRFYFSSVTQSGYVPFHWHESIELIFVLNGRLQLTVNGVIHRVGAGQFIAVPSGAIHDVTNESNQAYVLQVPLDAISPFYPHPEEVGFLDAKTDLTATSAVGEYLRRMEESLQSNGADAPFTFEINFLSALRLLFTTFRNPAPSNQTTSALKEIIIFINAHYAEKITVGGLANRFGYNESYLSRMFKQQTGIALNDYLYEVRLSHFYLALQEHPEASISALMLANGITNPRTGRKLFKEIYGCLPHSVQRPEKGK